MYKRVPIPKGTRGIQGPDSIRPIDVFSTVLRIHATTAVSQIKAWTWQVMHPGQFATKGGVLKACSHIAWITEKSLLRLETYWGVTVDFAKMFNMLSGRVAAQVALFMGLALGNVMSLLVPIMYSRGIWRLPYNALALEFSNSRGLPQGMASSVLLSELAICPLLWRISRGMPHVEVMAYVDDLNFAATSKGDMMRTIELLREFEADFRLSMSQAKTHVWASEKRHARDLEQQSGFQATSVIQALGAEWPVAPGAKPLYEKEHARLDECIRRLQRARCLPVPLTKMAHFISVGCLSLLDFLNLPNPRPYLALRGWVKAALGNKAGSPEVLVNILQRGSLDPQVRWLMAGLRLWHFLQAESPSKEQVDEIIESAKGRLGMIAVFAFKWGVPVRHDGFEIGDMWIPQREQWYIARKAILVHLKGEQARNLAKRRPRIFAGLQGWNVKQHVKLIDTLAPYQAATMLKLWSGAIMCAHKRSQVFHEEAKCMCGHPDQTIYHVLWECPMVQIAPPHLDYRRHLEASRSVAHLLPPFPEAQEVMHWRESCLRAIRILQAPPERQKQRELDVDLRGHVLGTGEDGQYTFCRKCYFTRKSRDRKWIWMKECLCADHVPRSLGEVWVHNGHEVQLSMARWKTLAQRPRVKCLICQNEAWATKGLVGVCGG